MKLVVQKIRRNRGMALLLALIAVMALSVIAAGLYEASQASWEENTLSRARYQAGILAESGLSIALHPDIEPGDVALRHELAPGRSWEVRITSEGGRFPVNSMGEERLRTAAVEMFVLWGLDAATASRVADSIADWIDSNSDPLPNGAENTFYAGVDYPQFPPNADITSLEELAFVSGMEEVEKLQPFWRDHFTIRSDALIDFNAASRELIQALTGATADAAANFVAVRNGDDGIEGTVDDYTFDDSGEVQSLLGISDGEWSEFSEFVTLEGTIRRIESIGKVGDFTETRVILAEETTEGGNTILKPIARFRE